MNMSFLPEKIGAAFASVNPRLSKVFLPWVVKNPRYLRGAPKLLKAFNEAEEIRASLMTEEDVMIPPIMILSITNRCNLSCDGASPTHWATRENRLRADLS
ncbi:MAG TPA: hypothetical protein PKG97_10485 [Mesotoga infera]|nr:hypothetical protein [Mesotoga infera]